MFPGTYRAPVRPRRILTIMVNTRRTTSNERDTQIAEQNHVEINAMLVQMK